jgi:hypothetical protein
VENNSAGHKEMSESLDPSPLSLLVFLLQFLIICTNFIIVASTNLTPTVAEPPTSDTNASIKNDTSKTTITSNITTNATIQRDSTGVFVITIIAIIIITLTTDTNASFITN